MIKVKGDDLPVLDSKTNVIIEILTDFNGISPYFCEVSLATVNQLNALIIRKEQLIERRRSLKVRTDISFYIESLYRNDEDITKDFPNMKINLLNLSIGGMLISSNYDLKLNDVVKFYFQYENYQIILLKAKVIRIDKIIDHITKEISAVNYGCTFDKLPSYNEAVITKYLYDRQLKLYKDR
jgi:c-di-GMP-binding flagellar brake protein YcgR